MSYKTKKLKDISIIKTGKIDSNAAIDDGEYPFFTCDPKTLRINKWAYDTEAVLLAGNNANGKYTAKYYKGRFNAYQRTYIIETINEKELLVRFLCYVMNQQLHLLKTMSSGSTTKFLTIKMLNNLDIPYPSIEVQNKIVGILGSIDDLIENNQKQIKLLEEAAQRLYKEWFVDLRFPGYEKMKVIVGVPEGWKKRKVTDFLEVKYGKDHKALEDGDIPAYGSGGVIRKVKSILYSGESILIPRKGSLNNIMYVTGDFWTIDTMFFSKPRMDNILKYTYLFLKRLDMYSFNIGAAVPSMTVKILDGIDILQPDEKTLVEFEKIMNPMFSKIGILATQIKKMQQTRDGLLPKLINGEIEV